MFKGLRACLQVAETNSDALLRVNQILYDMMQDLPRSPNELLPEVTALIPFFIENLGNSKVSVNETDGREGAEFGFIFHSEMKGRINFEPFLLLVYKSP